MDQNDARDARPGISAVLATHDRQVDLDGAVLDLAAVLDGLVYDNFEIILVEEEESSPRTSEVLAGLQARCPGLPLRVLEERYADRSVALAAGFDAARYDLLFVTAADGRFDVRELNHLLEAVEQGADLAIGFRGRTDTLLRRLQHLLIGRKGRDVDCAFKLIRRAVLPYVGTQACPASPTCCGELLSVARDEGYRVAEVRVSDRTSQSAPFRPAPASAGQNAA